MPPDALICATARSVLTRISAPSTAVLAALSSSTPILIGGPLAWLDELLLLPPPQPATASRPAQSATDQRWRHPANPGSFIASTSLRVCCPLDQIASHSWAVPSRTA